MVVRPESLQELRKEKSPDGSSPCLSPRALQGDPIHFFKARTAYTELSRCREQLCPQ